jgi:ABC-2 type transport system ATP-binding protein
MIHVENLTKYYDGLCAVDHIDLDVQKGEILGLLGPNGAGKTTTLRMLTGYFLPTSGTIRIKDYSIHEHLVEIKKLIGYLPESAPLYYNMLVYDYLDYIARISGFQKDEKNSRIRFLADTCGLNNIMHLAISELSRGLKQRVGIAHAMMSDPEILILDEPTSGLDPNQIVEIRDIVREIGKQKTVILSTHILSEVEAVCDRVVIINKGKIIVDDQTANLKQSAGREHVIHLSLLNADFMSIKTQLEAIEGIVHVERYKQDQDDVLTIRLTSRSDTDLRRQVYHAIKQTDCIIIEFYQETKTLEAIFRELTKDK